MIEYLSPSPSKGKAKQQPKSSLKGNFSSDHRGDQIHRSHWKIGRWLDPAQENSGWRSSYIRKSQTQTIKINYDMKSLLYLLKSILPDSQVGGFINTERIFQRIPKYIASIKMSVQKRTLNVSSLIKMVHLL